MRKIKSVRNNKENRSEKNRMVMVRDKVGGESEKNEMEKSKVR